MSVSWEITVAKGSIIIMFFVYALLLSVTIIFGSRANNKVLGQREYLCSRCQRQGYHAIVRSSRWFTLYFIPIFPVGKSTTSRCNLCGYQEKINNEQADGWFSQAQGGAVPQTIQAPQKTPQQLMEEGLSLTRTGRYAEAIAIYDQVLQYTPNDPNAYFSKGEALYNIGRYQEAIVAYDRAAQIAPQVPHAYYSKGKALEKLGRMADAQIAYATAQRLRG